MGVRVPAGPGGGVRVSPDERKLRKQLEETRKTLERWDGWSPHEAPGRCLRWLGEREEAAEER
jgi:hypothetical protein